MATTIEIEINSEKIKGVEFYTWSAMVCVDGNATWALGHGNEYYDNEFEAENAALEFLLEQNKKHMNL